MSRTPAKPPATATAPEGSVPEAPPPTLLDSDEAKVDLASVLVIDPRALLADSDAYSELQRLAVLAAEAVLRAQTPGDA